MGGSFRINPYIYLRFVQIQVSVTKNYALGVFADFHNLFYKVVHSGVTFAHDAHIYYIRSGHNIPKKREPNRVDRFHGKISRCLVSFYCDLLYWNSAILLSIANKIYSVSRHGSIRSRNHMPNSFDVFPSLFEDTHQSTILVEARALVGLDLHSDQIRSSRGQIAHPW